MPLPDLSPALTLEINIGTSRDPDWRLIPHDTRRPSRIRPAFDKQILAALLGVEQPGSEGRLRLTLAKEDRR